MNLKNQMNVRLGFVVAFAAVASLSACSNVSEKTDAKREVASTTMEFHFDLPTYEQLRVLADDAENAWATNRNKDKSFVPNPAVVAMQKQIDDVVLSYNGQGSYALDNSISKGAQPQTIAKDPGNQYLRFSQWNIERGEELDTIRNMLSFDDSACAGEPSLASVKIPWDQKHLDLVTQNKNLDGAKLAASEACALRKSDILVLNEVDMGVCRSNYKFVAEELAHAAGMNFVFAPEFVELEHNKLGLEPDGAGRDPYCDKYDLAGSKKEQMHNLTGNAILSKYPISNVRVIPLAKSWIHKKSGLVVTSAVDAQGKTRYSDSNSKPVKKGDLAKCYDWHDDEISNLSVSEKAKNKLSNVLFREENRRELRYGRRNAIVADVLTPSGMITVVDTHLENKTSPECRKAQMTQIMNELGAKNTGSATSSTTTQNPIVLAGDLNTFSKDLTHHGLLYTLFGNTIGNATFDVSQTISNLMVVNPWMTIATSTRQAIEQIRTVDDPTVKDLSHRFFFGINVDLLANPEAHLFDMLKKARFTDSANSDFGFMSKSNSPNYYVNPNFTGTWSATNARKDKGYEATEYFNRTLWFLGEFKIDWIFVANQKEFLRPAFPETLNRMHAAMGKNFPSDHVPVTVLLNLPKASN